MSEMELKKGMLRLFPRIESETEKDYVLRFLKEKKLEVPDFYDPLSEDFDVDDLFSDLLYRKSVRYKGLIYDIVSVENIEDGDIFEASRVNDTDINFVIQFYNGGCSFSEAIKEALDKLEEVKVVQLPPIDTEDEWYSKAQFSERVIVRVKDMLQLAFARYVYKGEHWQIEGGKFWNGGHLLKKGQEKFQIRF